MPKIQIVTRDKSGCDYYRGVLPAIYLQKDSEWSKNNTVEMLWMGQDEWQIDCDILMYNKFIVTPVEELVKMKQKGMKIIVDIDDWIELPTYHPSYKQWYSNGHNVHCIEHMKIADVVVCTSLRLQDKIRQYNKNTVVIPNALPFGEGQYSDKNWQKGDKTRFLYAGGSTHLQDVELLKGKFKRIGSSDIRNNSEYILAGYDKAKEITRVYATKEDMDAQNSNYKMSVKETHGPYDDMKGIFAQTGSYRVINSQHISKYLECYDYADVSLVPLVDNEWNSYKSELKILEAATRKIPVICSQVHPYSDLLPCEGIMWVQKPDHWMDHIKYCIKNPQYITDMGNKLSEWVQKEYNLNLWNQTRKQLISSLI